MSQATERATMPKGTHAVLEHRTVFNANQNLLSVVKQGDHVLDVGCGSGSITANIASLVGNTGSVTGIDTSAHLIKLAKENYSSVSNVHFEVEDILHYSSAQKFDVVSAARVLQWVANPKEILIKMAALLKPGGYVSILDYNHKKIQWAPVIPACIQRFYKAFLQWRKDAGMDNEIADHPAAMFEETGLKNITVSNHSEITKSTDKDFATHINIWAIVAATRGKQLVNDGYITEEERATAEQDYLYWIATRANFMDKHLLAVTGQK